MGDVEFLFDRVQGRLAINQSSASFAAHLAREARAGCAQGKRPFVLGVSGGQGSGKTTIALLVKALLEEKYDRRVALLSLDDFYLTKFERRALAREVHPLCGTRGVAGTHDVALMAQVLDSLSRSGPDDVTAIPVFDKLPDDRAPRDQWVEFQGCPDIVILEGWCVGLTRAALGEWTGPINALEAGEDPDGIWARWSAASLPNYEAIWQRIGLLAGIVLPDIETVVQSRLKQEQGLVEQGGDAAKAMDEAGVRRFVAHYERHTLAIWRAFPDLADVLVRRSPAYEYEIIQR